MNYTDSAKRYLTTLAIDLYGDSLVFIDSDDHGEVTVYFAVMIMTSEGIGLDFRAEWGDMVTPVVKAMDWLRAEALLRQVPSLAEEF